MMKTEKNKVEGKWSKSFSFMLLCFFLFFLAYLPFQVTSAASFARVVLV